MPYFVGALKDAGHPFMTFIIGDFVAEDEINLTIRNAARIMEMPGQGGMGLNFMTDSFFTVDRNVTLERQMFLMWRILDPELDLKMIRQVDDFYSKIRANRSGLVTPTLDAGQITRKVLNERQ